MAQNFPSQLLHPRDRLPKIVPQINTEPGRFWISIEEFNGCAQRNVMRFRKN